MGGLSEKEVTHIKIFLHQAGVKLERLREELTDHLICDIEDLMKQGASFDEAWQQVHSNIHYNQFEDLQDETVNILNKQINLAKFMVGGSFILLTVSTVFKLMHWPGANILLLGAFGFLAMATVVASVRIYFRVSEGRYIILASGLLIVSFILSIILQILHLSGGLELRVGSVLGLALFFPLVSCYFFREAPPEDHPLIQLISKNQHSIERLILGLLCLALAFKLPVLLGTSSFNFAPTLFLVLVIFITGIYFYSLTWRFYSKSTADRGDQSKVLLLVASAMAFVLFTLPALEWVLSREIRELLATGFYLYLGVVIFAVYGFYHKGFRRILALIGLVAGLVPLIGYLDYGQVQTATNTVQAISIMGLLAVLILFYKHWVLRLFTIMLIAYLALTHPG